MGWQLSMILYFLGSILAYDSSTKCPSKPGDPWWLDLMVAVLWPLCVAICLLRGDDDDSVY